jgi:hypothetical protein
LVLPDGNDDISADAGNNHPDQPHGRAGVRQGACPSDLAVMRNSYMKLTFLLDNFYILAPHNLCEPQADGPVEALLRSPSFNVFATVGSLPTGRSWGHRHKQPSRRAGSVATRYERSRPDADEQLGQPIVSNGLPPSKIHHAAFDANLIGIDPDYRIHVADRLLDLHDGPFLERGLTVMAGAVIQPPRRREHFPDRDRLELRFEQFKRST